MNQNKYLDDPHSLQARVISRVSLSRRLLGLLSTLSWPSDLSTLSRLGRAGVVLCLFGASSPAAGNDLTTDRPDQTESAVVVPPGSLQLEVGLTWTPPAKEKPTGLEGPQTLVRLGLSKAVELRLGWEGILPIAATSSGGSEGRRRHEPGGLSVGTKVAFGSILGSRTESALLVTAALPGRTEPRQSGKWEPEFRWSTALELDFLEVAANFGWKEVLESEPLFDIQDKGIWSLVAAKELASKTGGYLEFFGEFGGGGNDVVSFDLGMTHLLSERSQVDVAVGVVGLGEDEDLYLSVGYSLRHPF